MWTSQNWPIPLYLISTDRCTFPRRGGFNVWQRPAQMTWRGTVFKICRTTSPPITNANESRGGDQAFRDAKLPGGMGRDEFQPDWRSWWWLRSFECNCLYLWHSHASIHRPMHSYTCTHPCFDVQSRWMQMGNRHEHCMKSSRCLSCLLRSRSSCRRFVPSFCPAIHHLAAFCHLNAHRCYWCLSQAMCAAKPAAALSSGRSGCGVQAARVAGGYGLGTQKRQVLDQSLINITKLSSTIITYAHTRKYQSSGLQSFIFQHLMKHMERVKQKRGRPNYCRWKANSNVSEINPVQSSSGVR